ncbi:hypothetical protein [Streptosporangium minutum]|nr:hypothetical protein [Streptosporangium minutum]
MAWPPGAGVGEIAARLAEAVPEGVDGCLDHVGTVLVRLDGVG